MFDRFGIAMFLESGQESTVGKLNFPDEGIKDAEDES
jgi:hypothetical protein